MRWFYNDKKTFASLSQILKTMPIRFIGSTFTTSLLEKFWTSIQTEIIKKQVVPFIVMFVLAISYFTLVLAPEEQNDANAGLDEETEESSEIAI